MFINVENFRENYDFLLNIATLLALALLSIYIVMTAGLSMKGIKKVKIFFQIIDFFTTPIFLARSSENDRTS